MPFLKRFYFGFELFMVIIYVGVGILFLFFPVVDEVLTMSRSNKTLLGIIFVLYAFFKLYRAFQKRKYDQDGENKEA